MSVAIRRKSSTLLLFAALILLGISFWMWRELSVERARAELLQSRIVELEGAQASVPEVAIAPVERPPGTPVPVGPVEEKALATRAVAKPTSDAQRWTDYGGYEYRWLSNPQYREAWRAQRRLEIGSANRDLAAALQISQDTADQLLDLWVEDELRWATQPHRNPATDEERRARELEIEEAQRLHDAQIAKLLGADRVQDWENYQASLPTRQQVYELRSTLAEGTEPLRAEQVEPLISAIYVERKQLQDEMLEYTGTLDWSDGMPRESHARRNERHVERATAANERIHAAAVAILSPLQLARLDDILQRELDIRKAQFQLERTTDDMSARGKLNLSKSD